jgi:exopolysaccharide production protein ExoQ
MHDKSRETSDPMSHLVITWILMVPIFIFASDGSLWFDTTADGNTLTGTRMSTFDTQTVGYFGKYYLVPTALLIIFLAATRFRKIATTCRNNRVFLGLSLYAGMSCFWSEAPLASFVRSGYLFANVVFALYLLTRFARGQQLRLLYYAGWIIVTTSIFLAIFIPQYGIGHRGVGDGGAMNPWQGIFPHKNTCGVNVVYLLSAALYAPVSGWIAKAARALYVVLSLVLLAECQSRTSWIICACLFSYIGLMYLLAKFRMRDRLVLLTSALLLFAFLSTVITQYYSDIMYAIGKDPTMDGRTTQWIAVLDSIMKRPVLGYGYEAFFSGGLHGEAFNLSQAVGYALPGIDSGYLNLWIGLGVVALCLFVYSAIRAIKDATFCLQNKSSAYIAWCLSIVMLCLISNVSERMMMNPNNLAWIMYMVACGGLSAEATRIRAAGKS